MKLVLALAVLVSCSAVFAQGSKGPAAVTADDIRCEKVTGMALAEFKLKLVDNCDLTKPFSSSLSSVLSEVTYFYCCQKKK